MVQNPKGGGLSSSFGGGSQQVGGVQKTSDFLDRSTWILASLLLVLILISNATLTPNNKSQDSKLFEEGATEQNIPGNFPEIQEVMPEEIPDIPDVTPSENN
jgi:preprotein translocase subunit SecG